MGRNFDLEIFWILQETWSSHSNEKNKLIKYNHNYSIPNLVNLHYLLELISVIRTYIFRDNGFADNLGTHSLVAGLWSSIYSLGEVLGPTIGGTLVEYFDFPTASTTFAGFNMFLSLCGFAYFFLFKRTSKDITNEEALTKKHDIVKKDLVNGDGAEIIVEKFLKNGTRIKNVKTK